LLAAADIFCQPNTAPEGFGISLIEALVAGLPVVTTELGAASEIVDGACGVLVPPANAPALAAVLRRLIQEPAWRHSLAGSGPARARTLCDPATQIEKLFLSFRHVLDGLRAVSISLVLLCHLTLHESASGYSRFLSSVCGSTGVSFFFVISGYLITRLLIQEEERTGRIQLREFYMRRVLRIFPAFYLFLAVVLLLDVGGMVDHAPPHNYVACLLYIRNFFGRGYETSHLWSLSIEEQFYIIWPSLLVLVAAGRRLPLAGSIIACVCLWRSFLVLTGRVAPSALYDAALYMRTDLRMDTILAGCALALLSKTNGFRRINASVLSRPWVFWLACPSLVAWVVFARHIPYSAGVESTVSSLLIGVLLNWFIHNDRSWLGRILQSPPALVLGKLSYSLYLWQQLFLGPRSERLSGMREFPVNIGLTVLVAIASYFLVEKRFLAIKDRYFRT
jgi:peptidoglycan/LPS O-acetylase OafA/YrhL